VFLIPHLRIFEPTRLHARNRYGRPAVLSGKIESLPPVLGLFDAVTVVVGSIIGSGIFSKVGRIAGELNAFEPILCVWVGVGLCHACGSLPWRWTAASAGRMTIPLPREARRHAPRLSLGLDRILGDPDRVDRLWRHGHLSERGRAALNLRVSRAGDCHRTRSFESIFRTRWGATVQNIDSRQGELSRGDHLPSVVDGENRHGESCSRLPSADSPSLWKGIGVAMVAVRWPYDGWINIGPVAEIKIATNDPGGAASKAAVIVARVAPTSAIT
jgi:APA family basic amino acid/polyamine antiporter